MKKTIEEVNLAGFAITSAAAGQPINIQVKDSVTSDSPLFYGYAEQIANILAPKLGHPFFRSQVNYYLVLIHPDNTADVYWDDFKVVGGVVAQTYKKCSKQSYNKYNCVSTGTRCPSSTLSTMSRPITMKYRKQSGNKNRHI